MPKSTKDSKKTSQKKDTTKKAASSGGKKKTTTKTDSKKKKVTTSNNKKVSNNKKSSQSGSSGSLFKKTKIPVKVFNTPKLEEGEQLRSVREFSGSDREEVKDDRNLVSSIKRRKEKEETPKEEVSREVEKEDMADDKGSQKQETDVEKSSKKNIDTPDNEGKDEKTAEVPKKPLSFNLYRKIAYTFIVLTVILLVGVAYFSLPSLRITLIAQEESIKDSVSVEFYDQRYNNASSDSTLSMAGIIDKIELGKTQSFQSTGARTIGREIEGEVTIINNYSQDQPLVQNTRLLSPGGKLYRISEGVTVPAGGSVEAEIYSDDPSPDMAIGPTSFTIPGLWAGLQEDVYAESNEEFEYRVKIERYIQQSDIDKALKDIRKALEDKVEKKLEDSYSDTDRVIFEIDRDSIETSVDVEAGEEKSEFELSINAVVNIVAFKDDDLLDLATERLSSLTSNNKSLVDIDRQRTTHAWEEFDYENDRATLNFSFQGQTIVAKPEDIIDKNDLVNLNEDQLTSHLNDIPEIKDYNVSFFPSFIKKAPNLSDRIDIRIERY